MAAPRIGATQNIHSWPSCSVPAKIAGEVERARRFLADGALVAPTDAPLEIAATPTYLRAVVPIVSDDGRQPGKVMVEMRLDAVQLAELVAAELTAR